MQIEMHRAPPRGITQLMYVGDDDAALEPGTSRPRWWLVAGGLLLAAWLMGRENGKPRRSRR